MDELKVISDFYDFMPWLIRRGTRVASGPRACIIGGAAREPAGGFLGIMQVARPLSADSGTRRARSSNAALPAVGKLLQSADQDVRKRAAERLRQGAPLSVIPLRAALKHPDADLQKLVREELKRLGAVGAPATAD